MYMAVRAGSSAVSCPASSLSSPLKLRRSSKLSLRDGPYGKLHFGAQKFRNARVNLGHFIGRLQIDRKLHMKQNWSFATPPEQSQYSELDPDLLEQEDSPPNPESISTLSSSFSDAQGASGKPGLVSFYSHPYKTEDKDAAAYPVQNKRSSLLWFLGPAVLVASFIFPSIYLRKILSMIFEDSLLTGITRKRMVLLAKISPGGCFDDHNYYYFLILFFTEAIFYSGVAIFLLLIDHLRRPDETESTLSDVTMPSPQLGQRISSVATLVLSLIVPMVTMGFVWPWTGPAASATLAPYLVGIVVQFAFEQYARSRKSPSSPVIPIIFQVYRLHQLNRAAQLVTALSYTVKGAEMTTNNLEISSSLGTLLNVLQFLGVICIWSLSSFLMKFSPSNTRRMTP
ncbi:hypothetical protein LINPERHAP2_LOCUS9602 [Linum perenne]